MRHDNQVIYDRGYANLAYQLEVLAEKEPELVDDLDNLADLIVFTLDEEESRVEDAYDNGHGDGYSEGYADGEFEYSGQYDEGYADGRSDGYDTGYDEGHADGVEEGLANAEFQD